MAEIAKLRGFIFAVTFLGTLFLLIAWIPAELFEADPSREIWVPEVFEGIDVYAFAETKTIQLNETGGQTSMYDSSYYDMHVDIGGRNCDLEYKKANETTLQLFLIHYWTEWVIIPYSHKLHWYNNKGINQGNILQVSEMQADDTLDEGKVTYRAQCKHFTYHSTFAYNTTLYGNFTHAWNYHGLYGFFGIKFEDVDTSYNAFELIARLLFFQMPDIETHVNALMAIPMWATIAYLIYAFITSVIPFIKGA